MLIFVLHSVTFHFPKQIVLRKERREPDQKPMIDIPDELAHCAKCTPGHQQCVQQLCNAHHTTSLCAQCTMNTWPKAIHCKAHSYSVLKLLMQCWLMGKWYDLVLC